MSLPQDKEHAFDAFCKRVVKNEAINAFTEQNRLREQETVFSDLTQQELSELAYIDRYAPDRRTFHVLGAKVEIEDGALVYALASLPADLRSIVLLAYLFELPDREIARQMRLSRSAVQRRRTSSLKQLRKRLEEYDNE